MKKYIFLILLGFVFVACSVQRQQMFQIKSGLKDMPKRSFLNQSILNNARRMLLKEIDCLALGSDTIIVAESFVDVHGTYCCNLYVSSMSATKKYFFVSDKYNARPVVYYLKETKVSNSEIDEMQLIKTDIYAYLNKLSSTKKTPSTTHFITFAKKVNGKYVFEYYSADD